MLSRNWWGYCSSGKLPSEVDWSLKYSMMWLNYLKHCLTVVARPPLPAADAPWRPPAAFAWPCCVLQSPWFSYCRLPPCPAWWRPPGWPSPRRTRCSRRHLAFRGLSSLSIWRRLRWEWKGNGYEPGKKFEYQNVWKCRIWIIKFWHFSSIFVILKLTCLVTLYDHKLQLFKNSPKWTIFGIFN